MSIYDNLFTDKIFFGTKGSSNNLDMNNNLNLKLWKQLPLNKPNLLNSVSPNIGSFFVVKTFSDTDSTIIKNGISNQKNVYFDINGNLEIDDLDGNVLLIYKNVLTPTKKFSNTNKGNIFADSNGNPISLARNDLVFSPNKYWILYFDKDICYLLYNPIHRQSFKNYYNSQSFDNTGATNSDLNTIFNQYCEITSLQNDTSLLRTYADETCSCIKLDDCIDNATGIHSSNAKYRNSIGLNCVCAAPSCDTNKIPKTSFMYKDGNGFKDRIISKLPGATCPSVQNVICTTEIKSAGDINMKGSQINQQCGNQEPPAVTPIVPPPAIVTPPAVTPIVPPPAVVVKPIVKPIVNKKITTPTTGGIFDFCTLL